MTQKKHGFLIPEFWQPMLWDMCRLSPATLGERFEGEILWSSNNQVIFPVRKNHSDLGSQGLATINYHEPSDVADSGDIQSL